MTAAERAVLDAIAAGVVRPLEIWEGMHGRFRLLELFPCLIRLQAAGLIDLSISDGLVTCALRPPKLKNPT